MDNFLPIVIQKIFIEISGLEESIKKWCYGTRLGEYNQRT